MCHERCGGSARVRGHNVNGGIVASFPGSPLAPTKTHYVPSPLYSLRTSHDTYSGSPRFPGSPLAPTKNIIFLFRRGKGRAWEQG